MANIGKLAGQKRNLATGPLLADLLRSVVQEKEDIHYVSGYHPDYGIYLTWPFHVGRYGAVDPLLISLPLQAQKEFDELVEQKKVEAESIKDGH